MASRRQGAATVTRDVFCDGGLRGINGPSANAPTQFWKIVPINRSVEGHPIFTVHNQNTGVLNSASYDEGGFIGSWFNVGGKDKWGVTAEVVGLTFDDVTDANPNFWLSRDGAVVNHKLRWAAMVGGRLQRVTTNFFTKLNQCDNSYIGGWQSTAYGIFGNPTPTTDPDDEGVSGFYIMTRTSGGIQDIYGTYRNLFIPNPYFGNTSGVPTCIVQVCNLDPDKPWSTACLNYADNNPGDLTLAKLLTPRCTTGSNYLDRAINDPLCGYWCRAGLPTSSSPGDQTIHEQCLSVRQASCKRFYDSTSADGFSPGTPSITIDRCACFMPEEFYTKMLQRVNSTVPPGTSPLCFFQPCANSALVREYYQPNDCVGVGVCIQQGGTSYGNSCNVAGDPVTPPPTNPPGTNPPIVVPPVVIPPVVTPIGGLSIWVWIGIVLLAIVVIGIIIWLITRKKKPTEEETDLTTLLLLSAATSRS